MFFRGTQPGIYCSNEYISVFISTLYIKSTSVFELGWAGLGRGVGGWSALNTEQAARQMKLIPPPQKKKKKMFYIFLVHKKTSSSKRALTNER